jgi:peptidoglycan L-alanyl-D-glutamate endopeptidase CwlK
MLLPSAMLLPSTMLLFLYFLSAGCALWPMLSPGGRRVLQHALANLGFTQLRRLLPSLTLLLCATALATWLSGGLGAPARAYRAPFGDMAFGAWGADDPAWSVPDDLALPRAPHLPFLFAPWRARPGTVNRDWRLLDDDFARRLALVFQIMKQVHGIDMVLVEGYRSAERQDALADAGPHLTRAKGFQSYHQHGLAADCAFLRDGKLAISEQDPWTMRGYRLYGAVAESVGLRWGGRWAMQDFGHAELALPSLKVHLAGRAR